MGVPMRQDHGQRPGNAVAVVEKNQVLALLQTEDAQRRIIPMLGHGASYGRVMTEVWLAVQENAKIMECRPLSIVKTVARAVATGGAIGKDVYLVPYGQRLELIEDYKFLAKMIVQSGGARAIDTGVVYEGDEFDYELGTSHYIKHRPAGEPGKRQITHAYAIARVKFGEFVFVVMTKAEIDAIRQKYSKQHKREALEEIAWYGPKTCLRRLAKLLPSNPRLSAFLAKLGLDRDDVDSEELPDPEQEQLPPAPVGQVSDLPELAEHWSRSRPLANQADGFGYGGGDETPLAPAQLQHIADLPCPIEEEEAAPVVDEELSLQAAEALPYPWKTPPRYFGKRLGELPVKVLQRILEWAEQAVQSGKGGPAVQQYAEACVVLLAAQPGAPAPARPPQTAMPLPEPARVQPPDTRIQPGKVEDALAQAGARVHQMDADGELAVRGGQRVSSDELGF